MRSSIFARAFCTGLLVALSTAASAQTATQPVVDPRWGPWLGCWQLADESQQEALLGAPSSLGRRRATEPVFVCVTPAPGGVTMTTLVNDEPVLTETIVADGTQRPLTDEGCRGWHRGVWSTQGARLYADAEIACPEQSDRRVSSLSMMMLGPLWIDVQMIESGGTKNLRVRRYQRASSLRFVTRQPSAPTPAAPLPSRLSIEDVKEAAPKVAPEVLQAAIFELQRGFDLNGARLIELDKAGVPDQIIDLMIAQSFPKQFVVERNTSGGGSWGADDFDSMWPYYSDPFFYTSFYAPFGYRYWGRYDPYYFQGPGFVVVNPQPAVPRSGEGRVVDGRGYTRVRLNDPSPASGSGSGGVGASDAGGSSGSSGSGGSVSGSGYSSGGSSGGGGRTAVSRPPG